MQYRTNPRNNDNLSQLGFGCMRFPHKGRQIDQEKVTAMIDYAISQGVNYFDTAYIYPGSEEALGKALKKLGKRDDVKIATKLPPYLVRSRDDFDRIFNKQLERLGTNRIDYYLMHMLPDTSSWERLKNMGIEGWLAEKKRANEIINVGFSFHGGRAEFKRLVGANDWDFCMVQYNYLDENNQAGKEGVRYASDHGLPVFIMEPLRGGMLVNGLPKNAVDIFKNADQERSLAGWGLSWLYDQPEITLVLSGMGDVGQLSENIELASKYAPGHLTDKEHSAYKGAVAAVNQAVRVPCTGCGYCMSCPHGVDIPSCFTAYNERYVHGYMSGIRHYFMTTGALSTKPSNASLCKKCGRCEKKCPQSIKIIDRLDEVSRRLESFWFRPVTKLARKVMLRTDTSHDRP